MRKATKGEQEYQRTGKYVWSEEMMWPYHRICEKVMSIYIPSMSRVRVRLRLNLVSVGTRKGNPASDG